MFRWLRMLFPPAPRPSAYIDSFLTGAITLDEFASNVGDGWVGSDLGDWTWLDRIYEIEKRYNPDFPAGLGDVWQNSAAIEELRQLSAELRDSGR